MPRDGRYDNPNVDQDLERNPFVAFRRFADDQVSSLFQGFFEPFNSREFNKAYEEGYKETCKRFEAAYERATNPERRQTESREVERPVHSPPGQAKETLPPREERPNTDIRRPSMMDSFFGMFGKTSAAQEQERARKHALRREVPKAAGDEGGETQENQTDSQCCMTLGPYRIIIPDHIAEDIDKSFREIEGWCEWREGIESRQPDSEDDILAFQGSYSPLQLEHKGPMRRQIDWRAAFEDLLCAERGEPMMGEYYNGYLQPQPRGEWLMNMLLRGHVDMGNRWHQELFGFFPPYQRGETPESLAPKLDTELDVYDLFPHKPIRPTSQISEDLDDTARPASLETPPARPSILSTLTTTEHVRLPDGSSTTRRVLKKRFADGREECEDSTETTPAVRSLDYQAEIPSSISSHFAPPTAQEGQNGHPNDNGKQEEKKSWFWS